MATSSRRTHAACPTSQVCCSQSSCPWVRSLLTHASAGDTHWQVWLNPLWGSLLLSLSRGVHKVLFVSSKHCWQFWGLILKAILPPLPSCGASPLLLDAGYLFFGVIQRSPVDGCSATSCNLGVFAEDECTSFYSAILSTDPESKTLEKTKGGNLYDFELGNSFLNTASKVQATKEKNNKLDFIKIKKYFCIKTHWWESEKTKPQNVRTYHIYDKGLIPRINKELS